MFPMFAVMFPCSIRTPPTFPTVAVMFPCSIRTPPTFPTVAVTLLPVRFPLMSMFAIAGNLVTIPVSSSPLPMKYPAATFPTTFTCPLVVTLPPDIMTLPMFPALALTFPTLAYSPVTFPLMSMFAIGGSSVSIPSSSAPFPTKYPAATFPRTST